MALAKARNKPETSKETIVFLNKFYDLMFEMDLFNKFKKTYSLVIRKPTNYGYYAHIYLATGLSFDDLFKERKTLEQNLKCLWIMKVEQFKEYAEVQIVLNPLTEDIVYENPKIKPWQTYLGLGFSMNVIVNNNNKYCMFLIAGTTGGGKTFFIYMILLSWILSCSSSQVWLYLADVAKNELINFRDVEHVKYHCEEIDELYGMMVALRKEVKRRKKLIGYIREEELGSTIEDYNNVNKSNKLAYCYVLIDEFSVVVPDKSDSKPEKEMKEFILDTIKMLERTGRAMGIFCFICTQKTVREELPSIIKNMSAVRISFRANDPMSSEVIMGDNSAVGLKNRIAVYSQNGGSSQDYLFSPTISIARIGELLAPYKKNKHKKQVKQQKVISPNVVQGKVTPLRKDMIVKTNDGIELLLPTRHEGDDYIDH